jgi:hypothetical protein
MKEERLKNIKVETIFSSYSPLIRKRGKEGQK